MQPQEYHTLDSFKSIKIKRMLQAKIVIELFEALSPEEQSKCRDVIAAATVPNFKHKKPANQLKPEHRTDALVYDLVVRENNIKNTNVQAGRLANPHIKAAL